MEMEQYPLITAPFYTNQIEVIKQIAKSLPIGYNLYVKEHPSQKLRAWRSIQQYREIMKIPNVTVIHPSYPSTTLIQNCALAMSISGSIGFEAALYEKPTILFTDLHYSFLPNIFRMKSFENLPQLIKKAIDATFSNDLLEKYLLYIEQNSFDFDYQNFLLDVENNFHKNGFMADVKILPEQLKKFLHKNHEILEQIANEHIKNISKLEIGNKNG